MSNVDKRKVNKHIRIAQELRTDASNMQRSLLANDMREEARAYKNIGDDLESMINTLTWLKEKR